MTQLFGFEWKEPYNPLILDVLSRYERTMCMMAVTGDLDNLGLFVAQNGRARAENLVDHYNQIIRNSFEQVIGENEMVAACFIPAGEEIFALCISRKPIDPDAFIHRLTDLTSAQVIAYKSIIDPGETGVCFGASLIQDLDSTISTLRKHHAHHDIASTYRAYLQFMEAVRSQCALSLDVAKFKDIKSGHDVIKIRNFIFAQLYQYKLGTKRLLRAMTRDGSFARIAPHLNDTYGLGPTQDKRIRMIVGLSAQANSLESSLYLIGGGRISVGETEEVDRWILGRARGSSVLFIPAASGDMPQYVDAFTNRYESYGAQVKVLRLSESRSKESIRKAILSADLIYLGGGDAQLLKEQLVAHDLIRLFEEAAEQGIILAGISAGAAVWFSKYLDFDPRDPVEVTIKEGLGVLHGLFIAHFQEKLLARTISEPIRIGVGDSTAIRFDDAYRLEKYPHDAKPFVEVR